MTRYTLQYTLHPTAPFGLPDGNKIVYPAGPSQIKSAIVDTLSGYIVGHGTLSVFRSDDEALICNLGSQELQLSIRDNFATLTLIASHAQDAYKSGNDFIELLCRVLTVQVGYRCWADFQFITDESDNIQKINQLKFVSLGTTTLYNLSELREQMKRSFEWAQKSDDKVRKALLYCEHACGLKEYAEAQEVFSVHTSFSRALAFLQLFKALTLILGEPGTDTDYQRRFREFGLPKDFWETRVKPLYLVRNEDDVAHYNASSPDPGAFSQEFGKAILVLRDTLAAYLQTKNSGHSS